jgi:hypothetical protein
MPMARGRQARHSQANTCLMRVKVKGGPDCSCIYTTRSPLCNCTQVPPGRLERPHTAPEAAALSTELRGLVASSVPQAGTIGKRVRPSTNVTRIHEWPTSTFVYSRELRGWRSKSERTPGPSHLNGYLSSTCLAPTITRHAHTRRHPQVILNARQLRQGRLAPLLH